MAAKRYRLRVLGFISEQVSAWLVAVLTMLVGAALTVMLALADHDAYQHQLRQRFDILASERFSRIQERLDRQVSRLDTVRRFFLFSREVTREEYDGFVGPLLLGTQAYGWNPRVTRAGRAAFEAAVRKDGVADFVIRELDEHGKLSVAGVRDEYFPVLYLDSISALPVPLGFDIYSEPVRHLALDRARLLGRITATPRIKLLGLDPANTRGVLLMAPVFLRASAPGETPELKGVLTAVIGLSQLMTVGTAERDTLAVTLTDLNAQPEPERVYLSPAKAATNELYQSTLLGLGDRDYLLEVRPTELFQANNRETSGNVLWFGGLLSLMLSALLYSLISQRQRALARVEQRTRELRVRERELSVANGQLRNILNSATEVAIIATDLNGVINTFNVGAQRMLGYRDEEVLGRFGLKDFQHAVPADDSGTSEAQVLQDMLSAAIHEGSHPARELTFQRRDGSRLVVNMLVTAVRDDQGQWIGCLAVCTDMTEHRRVHDALEAQGQLLRKLGSQVPGGIYQYQLDRDGSSRFRYVSVGMCELFELDEARLLIDAEVLLQRIHPMDLVRIRNSIVPSAQQLTPWREEYRVQLPDKGLRWLRAASTPEQLADGAVLWHGFVSDITDLKRVEQELREMSVTDVLTGAYNRRYFQDRLQAELKRIDRHGGHLSIIMLDIDHFKRINDRFGHGVGDQVLKALSQRITHRLRTDDVFCRLGGEEFMVLCPGTQGAQAYQLALSLREELNRAGIEGVGRVTASFGIASWREGEGVDAMLLRADSGVYAAKQAGRDKVEPEQA
ncbi:diguanylate cyclase [Pseudomonas alliivorans]|uniref:diguanylate cyclase n=2 Tax=Pseudomonas TaxID=286 RepID=A0ABS4C789_9PSED|nr:diguanylate cyclase [Pseudomonas alliivorans]MBP0946498.1 diguanylate cyclase [Pseudomonas alliivorans]MEE4328589.1 diguanylate cyclase [Pseudomonas alliivorans]MEE4332812.1 diguanylate cyclase [Pseudomonas alliivorans]MEE4370301.1 diguanylate cyclase [Pseudomonas alliivorans]MEE4747967.1 diguanylate cyclase [Pseudomonas alliivorans]